MKNQIKIKKEYLWIVALLLFLFTIIFQRNVFELFAIIIVGVVVSGLKLKERKKDLKILLAGFILAVFFDPILKPYLDKYLGFHTVSTLFYSLILNGLLLIAFLSSYYLSKNLIKQKILNII